MAEYTIFGASGPGGGSFASGDSWVVGTAFNVTDVAGWRALGVRFYIGAWTLPADTYTGYLMDSSSGGTSPNRILATEEFTTPAGSQWNEATFDAPVELTPGKRYWVAVHFPTGVFLSQAGGLSTEHESSGTAFLSTDNSAGNGWFGGPGAVAGDFPSSTSGVAAFFGVDVKIDDGLGAGVSATSQASGTDTVTASRGGFPATVEATATVEDPLGASDSGSADLPIGGATGQRVVRRSFFEGFVNWGSAATMHDVNGPTLGDDLDGGSEVGFRFTLEWPVRVTGCRIYKPPLLAGDVPVSVWRQSDQALLHTQTVTMVADAGGWVEIPFSVPVSVGPADGEVIASYFQVNGKQARTDTVWYAQDRSVPPFYVKNFLQLASGTVGGSAVRYGAQGFPNQRYHANWYIDPIVEWDTAEPGFSGDTVAFYDQWSNATWSNPFPVAVFYADPPDLQGYVDIGVNTLMATGYQMGQDKIDAIKAAGMDVVANVADFDLVAVRAQAEDEDFAALLKGYFIADEPDMALHPWFSPGTITQWMQAIRERDSTRPLFLNLGYVSVWNQGYWYAPYAAQMTEFNGYIREFADLADLLSIDFYCLTPEGQFGGVYGLWCYPEGVKRMMHLNDGRTPIWGYVETTSGDAGRPVPSEVVKATWSCLIAGARGIVFFDHRFAGPNVTQDFGAMLRSPDMSAAVSALSDRLQELAPALHAPDAGIVTVTSSNTTAGPVGGTYGVPVHLTSRVVDEGTFVFAQSIRPGETTATFTAASLAGATLEVIGEAREVEVDGAGVWTDDFDEDYAVHLYRVT